MASLPYSFDDQMPAGAMRSMMRMPADSPTPLPLPVPHITPSIQPRPQQTEMQFQPPQPNWAQDNTARDLIKQGVDTLGKFGEKATTPFKAMDEAFAQMRKEQAAFYERLGKLNSGAGASNTDTPADMASYLKGARKIESGGDDNAVNPGSGATGRYQFLPTTAKGLMDEHPELGLKMEDLKKPEVQEQLMKLYTDRSVQTLAPILGRKPSGAELYLMHLLGHGGGATVMRNLDAPLTDTISRPAYQGNKGLLAPYKTGRELVAGLNQRFWG